MGKERIILKPGVLNRVFISYRREGGAEMARLVRDALQRRGYTVFMDVEDLRSGQFNVALLREIETSSDLLAILTPGCLERCWQESDWLRRELAYAIKHEKNVVPVMTRGFQWPLQPLPEELISLPNYNGLTPAHDLFEASMDKLATLLLARPSPPARSGGRHWLSLVLTVVTCLLVSALSLLIYDRHKPGSAVVPHNDVTSHAEQPLPPAAPVAVAPVTTDTMVGPSPSPAIVKSPPGPAERLDTEGLGRRVGPEVADLLKLAYSGRVDGVAPQAAMGMMVKPKDAAPDAWRMLVNGDRLSSNDDYFLIFQPDAPSWFYVFQIDSRGKTDWLFPRNGDENSEGRNPVTPGGWSRLPAGDNYFYLDETTGVETIYVVAASRPWPQLEAALQKAVASQAPERRIEQPLPMLTRGVQGMRYDVPVPALVKNQEAEKLRELLQGLDGALVKQFWFDHVTAGK